jgi:hypothetical protein
LAALDVPKRYACRTYSQAVRLGLGTSGRQPRAGGSVDLQSARDAPAGEFCRIEINTPGDRALALELSFRPLGTMEPLVVGGRELRRIDEDDEERIQSSRRYQGMPKARTVRSTMGEPSLDFSNY